MKPKILVSFLTGVERTNWVNPDLTLNLINMSKDQRFDVNFFPVRDCRPWESARNMTIIAARQINADWLVSFDNDTFIPQGNVLDVLAAAGKNQDVIGLAYGVGADSGQYRLFPTVNHGKTDGVFREEETVGGGVLMVRNTTWQKIPKGPWFRWQHADNEALAPGPGVCGEDNYFCRLVRQHGLQVWSHREMLAGHYRTTDLTGMISHLAQLSSGRPSAGLLPATVKL